MKEKIILFIYKCIGFVSVAIFRMLHMQNFINISFKAKINDGDSKNYNINAKILYPEFILKRKEFELVAVHFILVPYLKNGLEDGSLNMIYINNIKIDIIKVINNKYATEI